MSRLTSRRRGQVDARPPSDRARQSGAHSHSLDHRTGAEFWHPPFAHRGATRACSHCGGGGTVTRGELGGITCVICRGSGQEPVPTPLCAVPTCCQPAEYLHRAKSRFGAPLTRYCCAAHARKLAEREGLELPQALLPGVGLRP